MFIKLYTFFSEKRDNFSCISAHLIRLRNIKKYNLKRIYHSHPLQGRSPPPNNKRPPSRRMGVVIGAPLSDLTHSKSKIFRASFFSAEDYLYGIFLKFARIEYFDFHKNLFIQGLYYCTTNSDPYTINTNLG